MIFFFYKILNGLTLYLYRVTAVTIQELCQIRNLLSSIPEKKASITVFFLSVLKNGISRMIKSEIFHPFLI